MAIRKLAIPDWMQGYVTFAEPKKKTPPAEIKKPTTKENTTAEDTDDENNELGTRGKKGATVMDAYKDLFKPLEVDPKAPVAPKFVLDPKTIEKAAGSLDFASALPETVKTALAEGKITAEVFAEAINAVGRQGYTHAMSHMSGLTDQFVNMHTEYHKGNLGKETQRQLSLAKVRSLPSAKDNPIVKEHLEMVSARIQERNPDADPDWVTEQTQKYFEDMAKAINPELGVPKVGDPEFTGKADLTLANENFDWDKYLTGEDKQKAA